MDVHGLGAQRGQAREAGELVDEALHRLDLGDHGGGGLEEDRLAVGGAVEQLLAGPLDRELDRGQRVLDLVRDAPRRLAPGGDALGLHQLGQVLDDHEAAEVGEARVAQRHGGDDERPQLAPRRDDEAPLARPAVALPRRVDRVAQRPQGGRPEDLRELASGDVRGEAEQLLRRPVAGGDGAARVDGDHARADRLEDRRDQVAPALQLDREVLQLPVGALQLRLVRFQVAGHPVEGVHQQPDLVLRLRGDLEVEVAAGDAAGPFRQLLDRGRDDPREVKGEPGREEGDEQRDGGEGQRVAQPDRAAEETDLPVALVGRGRGREARPQVGGDEEARGDDADHALARPLPDRPVGLDRVAVGAAGARKPAAPGPGVEEALARQKRRRPRELRGAEAHALLGRPAVIGDGRQAEFAHPVPQVAGADLAPARSRQVQPDDLLGEALRLPEGGALGAARRVRGEVGREAQRLLHAHVEPALDAGGDELERDEEEQQRGQAREADEGHGEPRPQPRPDDAPPALEEELREVAEDQDRQRHQQDDVDVDEREDQQVGRERHARGRPLEPELDPGERGDEAGDRQRPEQVPAKRVAHRSGRGGGGAGALPSSSPLSSSMNSEMSLN